MLSDVEELSYYVFFYQLEIFSFFKIFLMESKISKRQLNVSSKKDRNVLMCVYEALRGFVLLCVKGTLHIQRGLCKAPRSFIHKYMHTDTGSSIQRGLHKAPYIQGTS